MKLADIVKTKKPERALKLTNFKPLEFMEQLCDRNELIYFCASNVSVQPWYYITTRYYNQDNRKLIRLLETLIPNWCEVSRYLQLLFNKDNKNIISSIENTRFNVSLFFRYFI